MIVYYENSKGEKLNLLKAPYRTVEADWFDSDWEESSSGYEKKIEIDVFGDRAEFKKNMENLYRIIAVDSEIGTCGKLYVNGSYLRCNILKSKKANWKGYVYSEVELVFFAPELKWIQEIRKSFFPHKDIVTNGLNFPFNFPFNFTAESRGAETWKIDHIIPNDFLMVIYGPCSNPKVLINGYPYEVVTELNVNEYLVIDSIEGTVTKYGSNGSTSNLFNERGFEYSVFEKIPSGNVSVMWSGDFGFEIILLMVRREALW
jgi:hypothetical protein